MEELGRFLEAIRADHLDDSDASHKRLYPPPKPCTDPTRGSGRGRRVGKGGDVEVWMRRRRRKKRVVTAELSHQSGREQRARHVSLSS
mmetsp:Transcript_1634/g.4970  ORF Transcript_1634/g.4970 Transcript_1634/m.4970 type:complete len:88 (-) Transcript_1634:43-306(-)